MCTTVVPRLLPLQLHCFHLEHHQGNRAQYCPLVSASDYYWPTEKWQNNVFKSQNTLMQTSIPNSARGLRNIWSNMLLHYRKCWYMMELLRMFCFCFLCCTKHTQTLNYDPYVNTWVLQITPQQPLLVTVYLVVEKHGSTERHHQHYECQPDDQIC